MLKSIVLVQYNTPANLFEPQTLYGCAAQCDILRDAFRIESQESSFQLILITGYSGTSKSSLPYESHKPIAQQDGILIRGKYEFSRSEACLAFLHTINNLCVDFLLMHEN